MAVKGRRGSIKALRGAKRIDQELRLLSILLLQVIYYVNCPLPFGLEEGSSVYS